MKLSRISRRNFLTGAAATVALGLEKIIKIILGASKAEAALVEQNTPEINKYLIETGQLPPNTALIVGANAAPYSVNELWGAFFTVLDSGLANAAFQNQQGQSTLPELLELAGYNIPIDDLTLPRDHTRSENLGELVRFFHNTPLLAESGAILAKNSDYLSKLAEHPGNEGYNQKNELYKAEIDALKRLGNPQNILGIGIHVMPNFNIDRGISTELGENEGYVFISSELFVRSQLLFSGKKWRFTDFRIPEKDFKEFILEGASYPMSNLDTVCKQIAEDIKNLFEWRDERGLEKFRQYESAVRVLNNIPVCLKTFVTEGTCNYSTYSRILGLIYL